MNVIKAIANELIRCVELADSIEYKYKEDAKQYLTDNPVDDWQELKIDDLPGDILVKKKYEFYWGENGSNMIFTIDSFTTFKDMLFPLYQNKEWDTLYYRPRQPEKKEPSHEEIMRKHSERIKSARRVFGMNQEYLEAIGDAVICVLESATIPPEAEPSHEEMVQKLKMGDIGVFDAVVYLFEHHTT